MIDWLTLRIYCAFEVKAGYVQSVDADGKTEWRTEKRKQVESSHSAKVGFRRSQTDGWLEISGNPSKWFQGHNLFGTDDLAALVPAFVRSVLHAVGYVLPPEEAELIDRGFVLLTRIDLTHSADFGNCKRALAAIQAMAQCGVLRHRGRGSLFSEGTLYFGQKSRRWSLKIYAKGNELKAHPIAETVLNRLELSEYADGVVRREVTIRLMELRQRKLHMVANWAKLEVTPQSLFDELAGKLNLAEATMIEPSDLEAYPPKLRGIYQLWLDGHDLRAMFPRKTFYRHRKALLVHGIDITVKRPRDVSNVVPLVVTLVGREVGVPDWARGTPLYFDPRAQRSA